MNNITSIKEKENIDTIKNYKALKLPWVLKFGKSSEINFKNLA